MTVNKNETEINKRNKLTGDLNAVVFGLLKSFKLKKKIDYVEDAQVLLHHAQPFIYHVYCQQEISVFFRHQHS